MKEFHLKVKVQHGELSISGKNDGFTVFEILGFLDWKKEDILKQLRGEIKPDIVKRKYIEEENNERTKNKR